MNRHATLALLALVAVAPLVAQSPAGWKMRVDRSQAASDPDASGNIKFVKEGAGFHCTNPQAAVDGAKWPAQPEAAGLWNYDVPLKFGAGMRAPKASRPIQTDGAGTGKSGFWTRLFGR